MNQRLWSSVTATLLTAALGTVLSNPAQQAQAVDQNSEGNPSASQVQESPAIAPPASEQSTLQASDVVKVGEIKSPAATAVEEEEVIAKIHAYELEGRQAATLYVRSIPVLTFLGSNLVSDSDTKMGEPTEVSQPDRQKTNLPISDAVEGTAQPSVGLAGSQSENDAVWRATAVAARLNQLSLDNVDAEAIAVRWNGECNCYSIQVNQEELVQINENTILPDTTKNQAQDALQATNRLRRLMGDAPPLREIEGKPPARAIAQVALGPVRIQISGIASWYGPGFHGNTSASGERYNQNDLTAAHRTLPFGTNVRVTNLNNGSSVIVRINDRGPYSRGRIIDLSAAAARVLGMIQTGVAPVKIEVLENR